MVLNFIKRINEWIQPKCDLCGKPQSKDNELFSDGIGLVAHARCWDKPKSKKRKLRRN